MIFIGQPATQRLQLRQRLANSLGLPAPAGRMTFLVLSAIVRLSLMPPFTATDKTAAAAAAVYNLRLSGLNGPAATGSLRQSMPFCRHTVMHLTHLMQVSLLTVLLLKSILPVGHPVAQRPQETHCSELIRIFLRAWMASRPRRVPTGQMLAQKIRPKNQVRTATNPKAASPGSAQLADEPKKE